MECVDGADLQTIGSATVCIVGKSSFSNGTMHLYLSMTYFSSSSDGLQIMHTQCRMSCSPVMQPFFCSILFVHLAVIDDEVKVCFVIHCTILLLQFYRRDLLFKT